MKKAGWVALILAFPILAFCAWWAEREVENRERRRRIARLGQ
jgi:hypothetical protein